MSCSKCKDIFAEPMVDNHEYLQKYKNQLIELGRKGLLPRPDVTLSYKVYSIRGSGFAAHKSIVLTTDDRHFITVELAFIKVDGKKHIYPRTRNLDESCKPKLKYHGTIEAKGKDLAAKAVAAMKKFGSYSKLCNNCQDYCNVFLKEIGLREEALQLTDGDKISLLTILGFIVLGLFAIMLWILQKRCQEN